MKKAIVLAIFGGAAVVCLAQSSRFPPINLYTGDPTGNACTGNIIQQSNTTGLLYTCQSGTMKAGGSTGSGNVTASPQFSLFYQPNSGSSATAQGDSAITTDGAGTVTGVGLKAKTVGGSRYGAQWQTGGGNNGIANAAAGATNQLVVADPSYANTERGFGATYFTASPMHYRDERLGVTINYYHNPLYNNTLYNQFNWNVYSGDHAGNSAFCMYDTFALDSGGPYACTNSYNQANAPGFTIGNPAGIGAAAAGWTTVGNLNTNTMSRNSGITISDGVWQVKDGTGDNYGRYTYVFGRNGTTAASDEGTGGSAVLLQTTAPFTATCTSGCTPGSMSVKTNGGAGVQGQGQMVLDTTATTGVLTGHLVSVGAAVSGIGQNVTLDATVTPSTAIGTIGAGVLNNIPPVLTTPYGTSTTFSVTVSSGAFTCAGGGTGTCPAYDSNTPLICIAGSFHEVTYATAVGAVSGGVQSITANIRRPHVASVLYQGGECGKSLEDTSQTFGGSPHIFDVVGSPSSSTITVVKYALGIANSPNYVNPGSITLSNATASSGTTVTAVMSSSTIFHPWTDNGISLDLSGSSDSALNATCTNPQWSTQAQFTCTIAALSGTHTTTTAMTAVLTPALLKVAPAAETIDIQNESLSPPQVDGTLVLEPNHIAWATSDTAFQTNHISSRFMGAKASAASDNPYGFINGGAFAVSGRGAVGGGAGTTSNSILSFNNGEPGTDYLGLGGTATPPNIMNISGYYGYGLNFGVGPTNEMPLIFVGVDPTQRVNPTYTYDMIQATTNSSAFRLNLTPSTGALLMQAPGNLTLTSTVGTNLGSFPVASNSALQITGNLFTGGSGTTTYPYLYINPSNSSLPSDWNTNGTWLGIQTHGASSADFANWKNNSVTKFKVDSNGTVTAPTITATATVNSVDVAASGTVTAANVTASSTVTAVNVSASGTIAGGGACRTGAPSGSVCSNGQMLSGSTAGIIVAGDSIGAGTGATPASPNTNGFMPIVANAIGGPYPPTFPVSGDQCADQNYNVVFSTLNPLGAFQDPAFLHELGTNDITRYTTTTNQQQIFQRCVLANLSWAAIPFANKKFGQNGTLAGGFAVDATATQLQAGLGASCTTLSCTATYTITTPVANGPVYLWYLAKDANGGTFTVKVDGVFQNDPFNGTTTWNNSGDGGALISTANGGTKFVAGARLPTTGIAGSSHTILITGTSATSASNIVEVYGIGTAPLPSTANPVAVAVSPNPQNNANTALVATYSAFVSSQVTTVAGDGLNVYFADTGSALLNISTLVTLPYTLTATTQAIPGWVSDTSVTYAGTPGQALTLVGSSPAQGQYSVSAGTYTINAADEGRPLLIKANVNCGSNSVTTLAANCMVDTIHPNNEGHAVMASVIFTTIPTGYKNGALAHPAAVRTVSAPILPTNPNQFWTPNPYGFASATAWNPGISLTNVNGNSSGLAYQANTGSTLYFPNTGGSAAVSFCPTVGGSSKQNIGAPPTLATCYFTLQANGLATFTIPTSVQRLTITGAGHTGAIALPTSAIAAGACTAGGTLANGGDGVSSTTAVAWSYNADPTAVTGYGPLITGTSGGLSVVVWTTSVTINTKVCNNNTVSITPGAISINVRALL